MKVPYVDLTRCLKIGLDAAFVITSSYLSIPGVVKFIEMYQSHGGDNHILSNLLTFMVITSVILVIFFACFSEDVRSRLIESIVISMFNIFNFVMGVLAYETKYFYFLIGFVLIQISLIVIRRKFADRVSWRKGQVAK